LQKLQLQDYIMHRGHVCKQHFDIFLSFTVLVIIITFSPIHAAGYSSVSLPCFMDDLLQHARFQTQLKIELPVVSGPDSTAFEPYLGLNESQRDRSEKGPIHRLQKLLLTWNKNLTLKISGEYDTATCTAIALFKLVHDLGYDGTHIDAMTAQQLLALENGWKLPEQPRSMVAQVLNEAVKFLGLRYRLGGSGIKFIDCGMFTRLSMLHAGLVEKVFNRTAAMQYRYAESGEMGLYLRKGDEEPQPGDLVFFNWKTRFQKRRYKGITHVGFYLGKIDGNIYVLEAASRGERRVTIKDRSDATSRIVGYAQIVGVPGSFDLFNNINMALVDLERLMIPILNTE
jgi:hypothetical protein